MKTTTTTTTTSNNTARRGFAVMDPARRREIASMGGKRAHELGRAHKFNSEEARVAGSIGGRNRARNRA